MATSGSKRWWHYLPFATRIATHMARQRLAEAAATYPPQPYSLGTAETRLLAMDQRAREYLNLVMGYSDDRIIRESLDRIGFNVPASYRLRGECESEEEWRSAVQDAVYEQNQAEALSPLWLLDHLPNDGLSYEQRVARADAYYELYLSGDRTYDQYLNYVLNLNVPLSAHPQLPTTFVERRSQALRLRSMDQDALRYCREVLGKTDREILTQGFDRLRLVGLGRFEALSEQELILLQEQSLSALTDEERYAEDLDAAFDEGEDLWAEEPAATYAANLASMYDQLQERLSEQGIKVYGLVIGLADLQAALSEEEQSGPKRWFERLPLEIDLFQHPRFPVWLRAKVAETVGRVADASMERLVEMSGLSRDELVRQFLETADMFKRGGVLHALHPEFPLSELGATLEVLRDWSGRLSKESARLNALCAQAYEAERGATDRAGLFAFFGADYHPPCVCDARLELQKVAQQISALSALDFNYHNSLVVADQARQTADQELMRLHVSLPVLRPVGMKRYRFLLAGAYSLDVVVDGRNVEEAKVNLRAERVVSGTTPQEMGRRYDDQYSELPGWCPGGRDSFWAAVDAVDLHKPFYTPAYLSVLVVREVGEPAGPERDFRFELSLPDLVTYKSTIRARSLYEAVDRILAADAVFVATPDSDPERYDWDSFDFDGNGGTLAMFGMITPDNPGFRARINGGTTRVGFHIL